MKRIVTVLLLAVLLCSGPFPAQARELPQQREDCSIELLVRYGGEPVSGGTLTAVKVGYITIEDGNDLFARVGDDVILEDVQSAAAAAQLERYCRDNWERYDFEAETAEISGGRAAFYGLSSGLYLIVQEEASEGFHPIQPFLISVPRYEDGAYDYHVKANIKSELERDPEATRPEPEKPSGNLPQTGQLNWPVPLLATAGLALILAGWVLRFGGKREENP